MSNNKGKSQEATKYDWSSHEREQILSIARESTPEQRFRKLLELIDLLGPYLLKNIKRPL